MGALKDVSTNRRGRRKDSYQFWKIQKDSSSEFVSSAPFTDLITTHKTTVNVLSPA